MSSAEILVALTRCAFIQRRPDLGSERFCSRVFEANSPMAESGGCRSGDFLNRAVVFFVECGAVDMTFG